MGYRMEHVHASAAAQAPAKPARGSGEDETIQELMRRKDELDEQISALSSVLDSVRFEILILKYTLTRMAAWREYANKDVRIPIHLAPTTIASDAHSYHNVSHQYR